MLDTDSSLTGHCKDIRSNILCIQRSPTNHSTVAFIMQSSHFICRQTARKHLFCY